MTDIIISYMSFQYGVKILVITSFKDTCYIEILPQIQKSGRGKILLALFKYVLMSVHVSDFLDFWKNNLITNS